MRAETIPECSQGISAPPPLVRLLDFALRCRACIAMGLGCAVLGCAGAPTSPPADLQQTIAWSAIGAQTAGTALPLTATASSGLPVQFASTTPSVCSVSGSTATLQAAGSCTIQASQPGNATYAAATPVSQSFTVNAATVAPEQQTITFTPPASPVTYGVSPIALVATASSGLPVSFSVLSGPGTVSGSTLTVTGVGTIVVAANQAGNSTYAAATQVTESIVVNQASQTITFGSIAAQTAGTPLTLVATASSGLAVSYTASPSTVCSVSGTTVTFIAAGTCSITASQAGNSNDAAATPVTQSFPVNAAAVAPPASLTYSSNPAVYTVGVAISGNTPSSSGGAITTYSVAPALPAGLSLNASTGAISGTPSAFAPTAIYVVTGSNTGGSTQANLSITVDFPVATPSDYGFSAPSPAPALPSSFDIFTPPLYTANSSAPAVAEWTHSAGPGNAAEFSLGALTQDTNFILYGQTGAAMSSPAPVAPVVLDTTLQGTASGQIASILLPAAASGFPKGMYLVWPSNSLGLGTPVAINRTEAWWVGPSAATVGDTVSVFGRNLTYPGTYTIQAGGAPLVYLASTTNASNVATPTVVAANPYKVDFSTANLQPDSYDVWIHNGAGGAFGWSGPLALTVAAHAPWNCQSSGPSAFNVITGFGATGNGATDDTAAILAAITAAVQYAANPSTPFATIYFPAGVYMISTGLQIPSNVCLMGAGTTNWQSQSGTAGAASILRLAQTAATCTNPPASPYQTNGAFLWDDEGQGGSSNVEFTGMVLDINGNIPCFWDTTDSVVATQATHVRFRSGKNVKFDNIVLNGTGPSLSWNGGGGFNSFDFSNSVNVYLTNSTIIGVGINNINTRQVFVSGNLFLAADNSGMMMDNDNMTQTAIWNNTQEDLAYYNTANPAAQIPYNGGSASLQAAFAGSNNPLSGGYPQYITNVGPYGLGRIGGTETYEAGLLYIGQNANLNAGPCDPTNTSGVYPQSYPGCYQGPSPPTTSTNQNAGEQILFEMASTDYGGMATASSATTVTVAGLSETSCGFSPNTNCVGEDAIVVSGAGLGQNRHIVAQSGTTLTLSAPWRVLPDANSKIYIANVAYQVAAYDNTEQGKADYYLRSTSLAGVEPWGNVYGLVYDGNQVSNSRTGIVDAALQQGSRTTENWIVPNYFNLFLNNTFQGVIDGIHIADYTYFNGLSGDPQAVSYVGDVYRNNIFGTAASNSPDTGVIRTGIDFIPCPIPTCTEGVGQGDTIQGIVLDSNTFVVNPYALASTVLFSQNTTPAGLWTDAGNALAIDTLLNNNTFTLVPGTQSGYTGPSYGLEFGSNTNNPPTPATATPGDSCVETGTNTVTGFATASFGLVCAQQ